MMLILKENDRKANWCKFDAKVKCFVIGACEQENLVECLKANLYLVSKELAKVKETRHKRHTSISLKWRDQSFYYKKRVRLLSLWIKSKGLQVPILEELHSLFPTEVKDETTICSDSEGETPISREDSGDLNTGKQGNQ